MAKVHYRGIPCGSKPFASEQNMQFWISGVGPFTAKEVGFESMALPETDDWKKVTCKLCLNRRGSTNE